MSTGGVRREAAREPELNRKPNSADTKFFDNAIAGPYEVYGFCLREWGGIDDTVILGPSVAHVKVKAVANWQWMGNWSQLLPYLLVTGHFETPPPSGKGKIDLLSQGPKSSETM
ncbi:predicted protein [Histoplasma capsulatum G186AR]|uniref:Uncharacterized protein n=1 Tax=Ajellomyces capsulatus (strain G186AR / H82 / ATCC MYA-2454 / RMSCC 2432) TaxID=447093 RepID=C0NS36_AJECG|nr:uncharacterized protein HCBG_05966 [Histoplasma capsulatum G186AR]EEH05702.1 predicted protein [Histoplasma capsulatum G186AR]